MLTKLPEFEVYWKSWNFNSLELIKCKAFYSNIVIYKLVMSKSTKTGTSVNVKQRNQKWAGGKCEDKKKRVNEELEYRHYLLKFNHIYKFKKLK